MNLRLDGNHIRFRISFEELEQLINGNIIKGETNLPNGGKFIYSVESADMEQNIEFEYRDDSMNLKILPKLITEHKEQLPSKKGIINTLNLDNGDALKISLEVDVRSRKRKKV